MYLKAYLFLVSLALIFYATVGVSSAQATIYTYDDLNRLAKVEYSDGIVIEYTYDEVGNRISKTVTKIVKLSMSIPDKMGAPGDSVDVPIEVGDATGLGITSVSLTVIYDGGILTATSASTTGTIAEAWGAPTYSITPGQITVDMASGTPLTGSGTLVNIGFDINPAAASGNTSDLTLADVELNAGDVNADLHHGVLTVARYGDVTLDSIVGPLDASWTLQYSVGLMAFTALQIILGEVSCNGTVTPYDAALILQYSVGLITKFPCEAAAASLLASGEPDVFQQTVLAAGIANAPASVARGVGKNYSSSRGIGKVRQAKSVAVSISTDVKGEPGDIITVPVSIGDVTDAEVLSAWLAVTYDDSLLTAINASTKGTIAEPWGEPTYFVTSGRITIAMASFAPFVGSGTLLDINFRVADTAAVDSTIDLRFALAELSEGAVAVTKSNGLFTVAGNHPPVAANVIYSTNEDTVLNVDAPGMLANDTDVDGDSLTAILVGDVGNGTLNLNSDGSFTYNPDANYNGLDSFTYRANDGTDDSNNATVTIVVNPEAP